MRLIKGLSGIGFCGKLVKVPGTPGWAEGFRANLQSAEFMSP